MFTTKIKVRYNETDQMGVVHHSNYYHWFEVARTELLEQLGFPYSEVEKSGVMLPVIESHCYYKNPSKYEDNLTVISQITFLKGVKVSFDYKIIRDDDQKVIAIGQTVHTFIDKQFKPINPKKRIPYLYQILNTVLNK